MICEYAVHFVNRPLPKPPAEAGQALPRSGRGSLGAVEKDNFNRIVRQVVTKDAKLIH